MTAIPDTLVERLRKAECPNCRLSLAWPEDDAADEIEALRAQVRAAQDRAVELDFAAERALEMLQSGRPFDAEDTLERVLGSGSEGTPS